MLFREAGKWTPPSIPRIDLGNPLSKGLLSCLYPSTAGQLIDIARPRAISTAGTSTINAGGIATTGLWTIPAAATTDLNWTAGQFTVAVFVKLPAQTAGTYIDIIGRYSYTSESVNSGWVLQLRPTSASPVGITFIVFANNSATSYSFASAFSFSAAGDYLVAANSDGATSKSIFVNGTLGSTSAGNLAPATSAGAMTPVNTGTAGIHVGYIWNRRLQPSELNSLYNDPFQMLTFQRPRFRVSQVSSAFQPAWAARGTITLSAGARAA